MQSKLVIGAFGSVISGVSGYGPPYNHLRFWNGVGYPKHGVERGWIPKTWGYPNHCDSLTLIKNSWVIMFSGDYAWVCSTLIFTPQLILCFIFCSKRLFKENKTQCISCCKGWSETGYRRSGILALHPNFYGTTNGRCVSLRISLDYHVEKQKI